MMTHNVYFWLKEGISDADKAAFEDGLRGLFAISEIDSGFFAKPASTPERPVTDHSFTYSLNLTFKSVADHDIYQDHPEHHRFVDNCKGYWQQVKVYDSEAIE